ncbi:MAG: hypothetical protein ACREOI_05405 [bacterium]
MKSSAYLIAAILLVSLSGCIWPEEIETRVHYRDNNTPPQITITWRNLSSMAENEKELKDDFDRLVEDLEDSTASDLVAGIDKELLIKDRQIYLHNGKLQARIAAVPLDEKFEDLSSNGERIMVVESESGGIFEGSSSNGEGTIVFELESGGIIETNGKLLKTDHNYIIVWPESLKEIYWIQRLIPETPNKDKEDWERWKQNRAKLIKMFEAYQQKRN